MSLGGNEPFEDKYLGSNALIRTFFVNEADTSFDWHRDDEDRIVEVLEGKGWKFQRDNCLPELVNPGDRINISKHEWHRIIKGSSNLVVKIKKCL